MLDVLLPIDVAVAHDGESYRLATRVSEHPDLAASARADRKDSELPHCVPVQVDLRVGQATSVGVTP